MAESRGKTLLTNSTPVGADQNERNVQMDLKDIERLRDVLTGDQLREMNARLEETRDELASLRNDLQRIEKTLDESQRAMNVRLALLTSLVQEREHEVKRDIVIRRYRHDIAELESEMEAMIGSGSSQERAIHLLEPAVGPAIQRFVQGTPDRMATMLAPVIAETMRLQVQQARSEMVDAIYPVVGRAIQKTISESIRGIARSIDANVRQTFSPKMIFRRLFLRAKGVEPAALVIRQAIPFHIIELLLIHTTSGLLITHAVRDTWQSADRDLVSGMLTAIRDFARDSMGIVGNQGNLDEIQYGERRILLEAGQHAYIACLVDGVEPMDFRLVLSQLLVRLHLEHEPILENYAGSGEGLIDIEEELHAFCESYSRAVLETGE